MSNRYSYLGIQIDRKNPDYITDYSKTLLEGYYTREGETIPQALARPATAFSYGDYALAQRIYDYAYNGWFMYASPVFSNAPLGKWIEDKTKSGAHYWHNQVFIPEEIVKGLPISCFAAEIPDTAKGQVEFIQELATLSMSGGGMGAHNSIRGTSDKAPGPIPYMKVVDSSIGYFRQGKTRKGAIAIYMDVDHPDILEHIRFRVPGGDAKRRSDNRQQFHTAVNLTDEFIEAVKKDSMIALKCPHSGKIFDTMSARAIWEDMLETRALTGEPYMMKIDLANRRMPESQRRMGLKIRGSNLCSEITLPTDSDTRTFVCCLSSLNLEKYEEWKNTPIVQDLIRFLDNVLQYFIDNAPDTLSKSKFSAERERALGLGTLGWHSLLQSKSIAFESGGFNSAVQLTHQVYKQIHDRALEESKKLAVERGEAPDMLGTGLRNSRLTAIAPNANSADLAATSPSIEPWYRNIFVKDTRAGSFVIKNKYLEALLEAKGINTKAIWNNILEHNGSVQHMAQLSQEERDVFKCAVEMDQHWLVELADQRGIYISQAQSLNLFFHAGMTRKYINSVHMKYLNSENVITLYYFRTEKESKVDTVKEIERKAMVDWAADAVDCVACQG
jgi:ribonucleoside-diphosphate reductase alpha chain